MTTPPAITGCILAGGQGRRLDGADKGLVMLGDRPLVAHCADRLRGQVSEVLISANRNQGAYRAYAANVFGDDIAGYAGPLAGLLGALGRASWPHVLTVPCDCPFLPTDLATRLAAALARADAEIAVARTAARLQPVFALVAVSLRDALDDYLASGERKIDRWFAARNTVEVTFEDVAAFANINTAEELAAAHDRLEHDDASP